MTQTVIRETSLEGLLEDSSFIFVVKKSVPPTTVQEIKISGFCFDDKGTECPSFKQTVCHFRVIKQLFPKGKTSLVGRRIDVLPAHSASDLQSHKEYYLKGMGESPIYSRYNTMADFDKAKELIVFLVERQGNYEFAAEGAYESLSQKKNVLDKIQSFKIGGGFTTIADNCK